MSASHTAVNRSNLQVVVPTRLPSSKATCSRSFLQQTLLTNFNGFSRLLLLTMQQTNWDFYYVYAMWDTPWSQSLLFPDSLSLSLSLSVRFGHDSFSVSITPSKLHSSHSLSSPLISVLLMYPVTAVVLAILYSCMPCFSSLPLSHFSLHSSLINLYTYNTFFFPNQCQIRLFFVVKCLNYAHLFAFLQPHSFLPY